MMQASHSSRRRGFNIHAFVFVVSIVVMIAANLYYGQPYWVIWSVPGWTIGILAHWFFVLGPGSKRGD